MVKRILKIVAICLAGFIVITGGAIGIFALTGYFNEDEILISRLYFANEQDDETITHREYYTLEDITEKLSFKPDNATNKTIQVKIEDTDDCIKSETDEFEIQAGEEIKFEINKDDKGNNRGGVANVTFEHGITRVTLKILVDVAIPDNVLYFSGNTSSNISTDNSQITTLGKKFSMGKSDKEQTVYLRSDLPNAFHLESAGVNLKSAEIKYTYLDKDGNLLENLSGTIPSDKLVAEKPAGSNSYYYKVPINLTESGQVLLEAKMHKTYEIQKAYEAENFGAIADLVNNNYSDNNVLMSRLESYSAFINKYIKYFDTNDVSFEFFKSCNISQDGSVLITRDKFNACEEFVFATAQATINVVGVSLKDITSTNDPTRVTVFSNQNYAIEEMSGITYSNIISDFDLSITLSDETIANANSEEAGLFETLQVQPYLYLSKEEYELAVGADGEGYDSTTHTTISGLWAGYSTIPVYGFDGNNPLLQKTLAEDEVSGYLILIEKDSSNKDNEYIAITRKQNPQDKKLYWEISYNVPLIDNSGNLSLINKALFLKFSVTGVDLKDNSQFVKSAYSRIYIDYTNYEFVDDDYQVLSLNQLGNMTINSELRKYTTTGTSSDTGYVGNIQEVKVNTSTVTNLNSVQYTNMMYFVEKTSNEVTTGATQQKVVAVGNYTFTALNGNVLTYADAELCGERLPVNDDGKVYLQVLNASTEPVKVFAVVYLSDKSGNPIDLNGKKLVLDESSNEIVNLYILEQTDITSKMPSIQIDSYVDNINLYSLVKYEQTLTIPVIESGIDEDGKPADIETEKELVISADTMLKRNAFNNYEIEGLEVTEEGCEQLRELFKLKLLTNKEYVLYASNFDLSYENSSIEATAMADESKEYNVNVYNSDGKLTNETRAFAINTYNNKELALKDMCRNFSANYKLSAGNYVNVSVIYEQVFAEIPLNYIEFRITRYSVDGANDYFSIVPNKEGVIYSELLTNSSSYNRVNYEVNEFSITDVRLKTAEDLSDAGVLVGYEDIDVELTSPAQDKSLEIGALKFISKTTNAQYVIKLNNETKDVDYLTFNNIELENGDLNRTFVDMAYGTEDLEQYLLDCKSTNVVNVEYKVPTSITEITTDYGLVFAKNDNGNLQVGTKEYEVVGEKFTVDNYEYALTNGKFTFEKGSYFPVVEQNGKKYAIILGEQFAINYNEQASTYQIVNGNDLCSVKLMDSEFTNYIKTLNNSAITKVTKTNQTTDQEETLAYVNFVKGESTPKTVYMMVTLTAGTGNHASQIVVNRSVQYNLHQEDVVLSAVSYNDNYNLDDESTYINTNGNPQIFKCGTDGIIDLKKVSEGVGNHGLIAVANISSNFFNHVEYMIENQSSGVKLVYKNTECDSFKYNGEEIKEIKLSFPDSDKDISTSIILKYTYKGETIVFRYYILVKANITLEINNPNLTLLYGNYGYSINSGSSIDLSTLFKVTENGNDITSTLEFELENNDYATFTDAQSRPIKKGTILDIKNCYSLDGKAINNEVILTISIKNSITFVEKLYITIRPTLTLMLPTSTPTIYNGESLFAKYIKIYNGLSTSDSDLLDSNNFAYSGISVYMGTYRSSSEISLLTAVNKGIIDINYSSTDVTCPITVVYTNADKQVFENFNVIVKGVAFTIDGTSVASNTNIDIIKGNDIDISNIINVSDANVLPMLVDDSDDKNVKIYTSIKFEDIVVGTRYKLGYGTLDLSNNPVLIDLSDYTVTINVIYVKYFNGSEFVELNSDLEINIEADTDFVIDEYLTLEDEDYVVVLVDGNENLYRNITKDNLVDDDEYNIAIAYLDDSENLVLFDRTEYGLTINVVTP